MPQTISTKKRPPPLIALVATGGTVAGQAEQASQAGTVANYRSGVLEAEDLLAAVPGLDNLVTLRCRQIANIGSEDMEPGVWLALAAAVREEAADPDVAGIVVLHGTDTMEETACFLDLSRGCGDAPKPVVMTGAMRPADAVSADGPANILAAARVAVCAEAAGRGVLVAFAETIHRAAAVYKRDSLDLDAFSSVGGREGFLVDDAVHFHGPVAPGGVRNLFCPGESAELPRVEIIYGHAGQRRDLVDAALAAGAWGIVHAGVGMGNIHASVRPALAEAAAGGVPVVCSTRLGGGFAVATEKNRRDGFVSAGSLNPQKARVLLQLALTRTTDAREIQALFNEYQRTV